MWQLATDTPVRGSEYQDWRRDTPPLFDDAPETQSFQLAVNFPLVDVDDAYRSRRRAVRIVSRAMKRSRRSKAGASRHAESDRRAAFDGRDRL